MKQNNFKKTITLLVLLLGLCLIGVSCGNTSKGRNIPAKDYISVQFGETDYDGYATPELIVDGEGLNNAADADALYAFYKKHALLLSSNENTLTKLLDIDFPEDYSSLSNGDKVIVTIKPHNDLKDVGITTMEQLEKELNIKFSTHKLEFEVSGLKELTRPVVELQKLVDIDFGKYNGYGSPAVSINESYLYQFINEYVYKSYVESTSGDLKAALSKISKYADLFDISLKEAYNNTSNGDKIYFSIAPAKEFIDLGLTMEALCQGFSIAFDTTETFKTVEGLQEAQGVKLINLFESIEEYICFTGANENGRVYFDFPENHSFVVDEFYFYDKGFVMSDDEAERFYVVYNNKQLLEFDFCICENETNNLSNNQIITVSVDINVKKFEENGYTIASERYNVSVQELGEYLYSKEQLTPTVTKNIKEYLLNQQENATECIELYFASINPGVINEYNTKYATVGIVHVKGLFGGYHRFSLYDVVIYPDGTVSGTFDQSAWSKDTAEEVIQGLSTDYSYEKIQ